MSNTLAKVKTTSNQQSQRVAHHSNSTVQKGPKPKTFAESLMNMLAMQNIGQAFSENPVEALSILQDEGENKRRNSNSSVSKTNASFVSAGPKKHQPLPSTYHFECGDTKTLDSHVHFPRLNDFKSATNNIYLAQRPVQDPRKESELSVLD